MLEIAGGGGAGAGAGAGFSLSAPNIWVKLPGEDGALEAAGGGVDDGEAGAAGAAGFSLNAPNICVKLPGEEGVDGGAALGASEGAFWGAFVSGGASGLVSGAPCFRSDARRSSSSRGGPGETVPNMPVALDELPLPDPPDPGASGLSKGALGANIRVHLAIDSIVWFRIPRLHRLGLTVKGGQPRMQANLAAARAAHSSTTGDGSKTAFPVEERFAQRRSHTSRRPAGLCRHPGTPSGPEALRSAWAVHELRFTITIVTVRSL